ncbi:MAG TPA: DEAD/DEAH box helicase, partial [Polyangiaceae bacterium]|nr:DEAD/DEAH box helicase [Polyangiaceae bacterium]
MDDVLQRFARPVGEWFRRALGRPTKVQEHGFRVLHEGKSALLLAPTGSGKTLAAFLASLDRLMFGAPAGHPGVRVLYVSPLKALGVDVERNLRVPLTGIAEAAARLGMASSVPSVALRSGDTPAVERARFRRQPSDILITTPESLYLLLTSDAARHLAAVETVIIDEIHALVGTKRGAHLALSLERLERLRSGRPPLVRVGLSATVRPVAEAAAFLGGATPGPNGPVLRPIEIVDATASPRLELSIRVPEGEFRAPTADAVERSLWPAIHAPLVELVREHRSTLVFVNSRRLAERLAAALNDLAGEPLVLAHHGSLAREKRLEIEEALKRGELRGLVATSSLELGIDMGAIDLVIQVEAPPSIASGLQRVGRAGHTVAGTSRGLVFPKFRGDLLACAAAADGMRRGAVEAVHYPRNPLDVLAQQIVAIASGGPIGEDELYALVRSAAPFTELDRAAFDSVLDLLSGRYASDAFAELKPRIVWDRVGRTIAARTGARHIAIVNGGTIPDRGLFGVYLAASDGGKTVRVGELDEEMVFESRPGDVVLLGASSFRIEEITFDRVLVTPAPGEPGRMPFWRGDRAGRSLELGRALGRLTRELVELSGDEARARLAEIGAEERAGRALLEYLAEQRAATGDVPSDRTVVIEHFVDEMGDIRVCLLSPFGARVHAPWALAAMELQRTVLGVETEAIWSDDGIVFRFPEGHRPEDLSLLVPDADDLEGLLLRSLAQSSLFAARFRENAARALLLPRRRPGQRTPLWAQRRRAADLLRAASAHPDFPILLETYRECLRDVFDVPGLTELLEAVARREVRVALVGTRSPSPFAAALLFSYVGNFIYAGDVPLAERRAQLLTLDPVQLRRLLGATEQRTLLDPESIAEVEHDVGRRAKRVAHADQLHDLLIAVGDLTLEEAASRLAEPAALEGFVAELVRAKRVLRLEIAGERRLVAVEDAARYRDALGVALPAGLPRALLASVAEPLRDLVSRYARTHGPFAAAAVARRFGIGTAPALTELRALVAAGRLVSGEFLPGGTELEFCEVEVLRRIKQKSLSRLRREIEPSPMRAYARLVIEWQGAARPELGHDA